MGGVGAEVSLYASGAVCRFERRSWIVRFGSTVCMCRMVIVLNNNKIECLRELKYVEHLLLCFFIGRIRVLEMVTTLLLFAAAAPCFSSSSVGYFFSAIDC